MEAPAYKNIKRRKTRIVNVGDVLIGGDNPIAVQSMTNTLTSDALATLKQIEKITEAGADIVRVSCPDKPSTEALKEIVHHSEIPIIADIHFHYRRAIEAAENGAACLRINPGNIGKMERVKEVVQAAKDYNCSIRIGVNAGSLDKHLLDKYKEPCPAAMVESALEHAQILEDLDFHNFKISVKASNLYMAVEAYRQLAQKGDWPLHLGITEAGTRRAGTVLSALGIGRLLWDGIGDTLRVSLSDDPAEEVKVGFDLLKAMDLRHRGVRIVSCPSCARQGFDVIKVVSMLDDKLSHINTPMTLSILGCLVNGPGEAAESDIGLTGIDGGVNLVYLGGLRDHQIKNEEIVEHIVSLVEKRAKELEQEK
ncbi:MAG: flavodoxin-dependent (E)-4-hydroxy-3-methylbut-2-enyl-diphosphate synthase [Alphaproteobacteria bacterium]